MCNLHAAAPDGIQFRCLGGVQLREQKHKKQNLHGGEPKQCGGRDGGDGWRMGACAWMWMVKCGLGLWARKQSTLKQIIDYIYIYIHTFSSKNT